MAMSTADPEDLLRKLAVDLEAALRAEGVPAGARDRIVSQVLYGDPEAPHRIYHYRTLSFPTANRFLKEWEEARRAVTSGAVAPHKTPPPCPGCEQAATIVTAAATAPGWFQVRPCGCLFDIEEIHGPRRRFPEPEYTFGTPVTPTTFLPMTNPEPELPPGLNSAIAAAVMRAAKENHIKPGWFE